LRRGKRVEAGFGHLRGLPVPRRDEEPPLRIGLVVPKRLGNAPQRNRIKRRLRAGLSDRRFDAALASTNLCRVDSRGARRGVDLGVFPSKAVLDMNFDILVSQLGAALRMLARKLHGATAP
jgi:ribonuclease P protein component